MKLGRNWSAITPWQPCQRFHSLWLQPYSHQCDPPYPHLLSSHAPATNTFQILNSEHKENILILDSLITRRLLYRHCIKIVISLNISEQQANKYCTWSHLPLIMASRAFSAMAMAFISGFSLKGIPLSLGISIYFSKLELNMPERFPFQTNVTCPNFTVSLFHGHHDIYSI